MTIKKISELLNLHHISHRLENERLLAEKVYTQDGRTYTNWVDLTDFNLKELLSWLGY